MMSGQKFNGVKVFSATMARDRDDLGERLTQWMAAQPEGEVEVVDVVVTQSSDASFHCIALTVFYNDARLSPSRSERRTPSSSSSAAGARRLAFKEDR